MFIYAIDHVQLAMPQGHEDHARQFYQGILGLIEVPKPAQLRGRGGVWFEAGSAKIHLGVEVPFHPAQKAHPGLLVTQLDGLIERCQSAGYQCSFDVPLDGYRRVHVFDPFGNRIELLELLSEVPSDQDISGA